MQTTYSERLLADHESLSLAQAVSPILKNIFGTSQEAVIALWDRTEDGRGRTVIKLVISDWTGKAEAEFAPEELHPLIERQNPELWGRLHHLWGDLLQERSHEQLRELRRSIEAATGA